MVALMQRPLRGVARRRAEDDAVMHDDHDSELVPLFSGVIAVATEKDFVAAVMDDLKAPDWQQRLLARSAKVSNGVASLHQPIHREFALALYEARCDVFGKPRIDPRKIVAQGLVVRKVSGGRLLGWKHTKTAQRGWLPVTAADDPSGQMPIGSGNAEIDRLLALNKPATLLQEDVAPLFLAAPDVCAALKKTILFGIVPVTSSEQTQSAPVDFLELANTDDGELDSHLSSFLRPDMTPTPPPTGVILDPTWATTASLTPFVTALRQLVQEAGMNDDTSEALSLRNVLAQLQILDFIQAATPILVAGRPNTTGLTMPANWPVATPALRDAFYRAMGARFKSVASHIGKYDDRDAVYQLSAFVKLTCGNCPPKLVWCHTRPNFKILPWWEGAGPPMRIPLPNFDLLNLPKLKPNVAFEVPKPLAKFLNQDFSKALENPPGQGTETGIAWICSFSIPIITICAFILLSIILALLNILFFWLPLVKICLPLPKVKPLP